MSFSCFRDFKVFWRSNLLILKVHGEGFYGSASCALYYISTFLLTFVFTYIVNIQLGPLPVFGGPVFFICLVFCVLFYFFFVCVLCPMLPIFMDCPYLIAPSIYSNVYSNVWYICKFYYIFVEVTTKILI